MPPLPSEQQTEPIPEISPEQTSVHPPHPPSGDCQETSCCSVPGESSSPAADAPPRSPLDGCPTPISWVDVLRTFHAQTPLQTLPHSTGPIEYRVWGEGPPVYFINGMGGSIDHFALLTHLMRGQFRCVIPDFPTVRQIGGRCFSLTLNDLADRVTALADHLGDTRFHLFTTSFGSLAGWNLMSRHPDRVLKAVVSGGFARRDLSVAERFLIRLGRFLPLRLRSLPLVKFVHRATHGPWFPPIDPTRWNFFAEDAEAVPVRDLAWRGNLIRDTDLTETLPQIQTPVLLVQGEGDGLVAGRCREVLHAKLPHSQIEMMPNTGHLPHITHPHRLGKSLRNFLLDISP